MFEVRGYGRSGWYVGKFCNPQHGFLSEDSGSYFRGNY